jgi:hypothetical protein
MRKLFSIFHNVHLALYYPVKAIKWSTFRWNYTVAIKIKVGNLYTIHGLI